MGISNHRLAMLALMLLGLATVVRGQTSFPSDADLARNWPGFRGSAAGIVDADVPSDWDGATGKNILWKTPIPIPGKNSPIVWKDSIFLSAATKQSQEVFCFDSKSGAIRWRKVVGTPDPAKAPKVMEDTGYAAATMTTDGTRVFAIFATGNVVALDFAGNIVWQKELGLPDNQYGLASSLLMWRDRLIIQFDQGLEPKDGKSAIIALEGSTGNQLWKTSRPVANSWTSPIAISTPAGPQIITAANPFTIAYEPQRGTELWRVKNVEGDVAPSPAYANGLVFVAMESSVGSAIKVTGAGDVTKSHVAWEADTQLPDIVSPLITDKYAYTVVSFGTVTCYDAATGKKKWEHEFDGPFHASPLMIKNVMHLIDRTGLTHRIEAADEFKLLSKPALGEPVSATPAVADHRIFIRGEKHLFAIGN